MACPFFSPTTVLAGHAARSEPRYAPRYAPLGDLYSGFCTAVAGRPAPAESEIRQLCNLGYARGQCPHFPASHDADAVRFAIAADNAGLVRIHFCVERDHHPVRHGILDLATTPEPDGNGSLLAEQARAYLGSYLRRRPKKAAANSHT